MAWFLKNKIKALKFNYLVRKHTSLVLDTISLYISIFLLEEIVFSVFLKFMFLYDIMPFSKKFIE